MSNSQNYQVLAYYYFTPIEDPAKDVLRHKEFFSQRDCKGRIYISQDGINGQISCSLEAAEEYKQWLRNDPRFHDVEFKIHTYHEHCFPRMTVKYRKQLVAIDVPIDRSYVGTDVTPQEWLEMLKKRDHRTILLDVRNLCESKIGHFDGAIIPPLNQFREFPAYIEELKKQYDPETTQVMMYCTTQTRCEIYSPLMKQAGFKEVYQLQGGIVKYGLEVGTQFWKGTLYVFDSRVVVPISDEEPELISSCQFCDTKTDFYFNCANMDCNQLFLSCRICAQDKKGCCSPQCEVAPRIRPFQLQERPKPFDRLSCSLNQHQENG